MADLTDMSYPCYVSPIYKSRIIYIPGKNNPGLYDISGQPVQQPGFLKLQKIDNFVLEGYLDEGKLKFYDCISLKEWNKQKCNTIYDDRLRDLRHIVNEVLADYSRYLEVPNHVVISPKEIKDLYTQFLTNGHEGAIIMDMDGFYTWGATNKYKVEIKRTK